MNVLRKDDLSFTDNVIVYLCIDAKPERCYKTPIDRFFEYFFLQEFKVLSPILLFVRFAHESSSFLIEIEFLVDF